MVPEWQNLPHVQKNGELVYKTVAGEPGAETVFDRERNERFWRSIRKSVAKGR
jgi:hypothetical protein